MISNNILKLFLIISIQFITGCSFTISNFTDNLNKAVKANNDPKTVMQALPPYLILMDGFIEGDAEDEDILIASAKLMNAYAGLLAAEHDMMAVALEDNEANIYQRKKLKQQEIKLVEKALKRASSANCIYEEYLCNLTTLKYDDFIKRIQQVEDDDIAMLYSLGTVWAAWIKLNSQDWNAVAQLPQVKLIMQTVILLNENWDNAGAHMYLGVLNSLMPASYGGKPEKGRESFEAAIKITQGKNLMAKVLFAEFYARLTFNEALHQKLISEVLNYKETPHDFVLINTLAIEKAKYLQASAEDYF
ncbi:hypothetical protein MNBD_GAMMA07-1374 [hydrothermal vent metagenome]|uniref:TRAP transporter TatT component family protein n=1 Tax=hydrothermal vent metagenome TaxID=652676 RepID=A0A3B0XKA9_9ZZZZ